MGGGGSVCGDVWVCGGMVVVVVVCVGVCGCVGGMVVGGRRISDVSTPGYVGVSLEGVWMWGRGGADGGGADISLTSLHLVLSKSH